MLPAVASVGTRPVVQGTEWLLEVHLLDFDDDIYGAELTVEFCQKFRDEEKFETPELIEQIKQDVEMASELF